MEFSGSVKKITYYNRDNGYGVVRVLINDDCIDKIIEEIGEENLYSNQITVVSMFTALPFIDQTYEFSGEFETSKYGLQFRSDKTVKEVTTSENGIVTYLSSSLFKGIGKKTAEKVYNKLGKNALKNIMEDKSILDEIDISLKQKEIIFNTLNEYYGDDKVMVELLSYGITLKIATKIIKALKNKTLDTVKENPYSLIDKVEGIGFLRADEIALKVGIQKNSAYRLKALIVYILKNYIYSNGNTYIRMDDLYIECVKVANTEEEIINKDNFLSLLNELIDDKQILKDDDNNIYDVMLSYAESEVARAIVNHLNDNTTDSFSKKKINNVLEEVEKYNNIEYSDKQKEAIINAILEPISIITGGPGTGKSTIIKGIIETFTNLFDTDKQDIINSNIVLVAPTGRAAKRLREVTFHQSSTIHKLLGYTGHDYTVDEVDCKMIIIDEFSMVDVSLAFHLFKALKMGTKIVIVGDSDQLPAVGAGDILNDLILSKEITTIKLDKIHRQAQTSTIISLAHSINEGYIPYDVQELQKDRKFINSDDENIIPLTIKTIDYYIESKKGKEEKADENKELKYLNKNIEEISREKEILINDIQVLVPMYRGSVGIDAFNYFLQDHFNPLNSFNHKQIVVGNKKYRKYDKVIQLVNRSEKNVMNGDIGYISKIVDSDEEETGLYVQYAFGEVYYDKDELDDITLAYAISIHKAQGSEFNMVIVPFSFKYYIMLKKKLIYTAITRAKKFLIMVGNFEALRKGILKIEEKRKTKLQEKIKALIANPNIIFDSNSAFKEISDADDYLSPYDFMD